MKKAQKLIPLVLVSLLATVVVSCYKDKPDAPETSSIIVSFNPGSLYEELDIQELMAKAVAPNGDYTIIDSVLVYDNKGKFVTKGGVESNSFGKKELELKEIPEGTYTLVLWQTVYRSADGVRAWKAVDEKSLSTVQVSSDGGSFSYFWALGIASATVTLGDQSSNAEMTPKTVGCIVDLSVDNFTDDMGYIRVAIVGGTHCPGVYLDPSRKEDPWIKSQLLGVFTRVFPDEGGKSKCFSLLHGENLTLWLRGDKNDGFDDLGDIQHKTLSAGENYTAYFDMARSKWQPAYFGHAEDFAAWKADRDAGILVFDPCLDWGCNFSDVEKHVHSKNWWAAGNDAPEAAGKYWCKYFLVAEALQERYNFATEDGKDLRHSTCYCLDPTVPIEAAHLLVRKQGFVPAGKIVFPGAEPRDVFFSEDKSTEVCIAAFTNGRWYIDYQRTDPDDLQYIVNQ